MKILFDTNVILDVMLLRPPFYKSAALLLAEVERKHIAGYLSPTSVTTIYYLAQNAKGKNFAFKQIENLLKIFKITKVDKFCLQSALLSGISDFEDAVLNESALQAGLDGIVTGDIKNFRSSQIMIYNPDELLQMLNL